jgi:hypothetical protein
VLKELESRTAIQAGQVAKTGQAATLAVVTSQVEAGANPEA